MSTWKKKSADEELNKFLIKLIKGCPQIYGDFRNSKTIQDLRNGQYESITKAVNERFQLSLSVGEVKHKWTQLRKGFMKSHKKVIENKDAQKYYLYEEMKFLVTKDTFNNGVIELSSDEDDDDNGCDHQENDIVEDEAAKEERRGDSDELSFDDVLSAMPKSKSAKMPEPSAPIMPPMSKSARKRKDDANLLESMILKEASEAFKTIKDYKNKEVEPRTDDRNHIQADDDDCFILPIEEALGIIPQDVLLKCVNGILCILKQYDQVNEGTDMN